MSSRDLRSKRHRHASRDSASPPPPPPPPPPRHELRGRHRSDGKKPRSPKHSSSQKRSRRSPSPHKTKKSKHRERASPPGDSLPGDPVSSDVTRQSADSESVTDRTLVLKQLLDERKQKRLRNQSPSRPAEAGDVSDVRKWVEHSRKLEAVPSLGAAASESKEGETERYISKDLKGMKIGHSLGGIMEGEQKILTLRDRGILDEETEETLENPTMVDQDRADKNRESRNARPGMQDPFDSSQIEMDDISSALRGERQTGSILSKYDEEISGQKTQSFYLSENGQIDQESSLLQESRKRESLLLQLGKREEDLNTEHKFASQIMTSEEIAENFRRIKKRRKVVPLRAEDLVSEISASQQPSDLGTRDKPETEGSAEPAVPLSTFQVRKVKSENMFGPTASVPISVPASSEEQVNVSSAVERIRRLRESAFSRREMDPIDRAADIARQTQRLTPVASRPTTGMIFDSTQEFVRSLSTQAPSLSRNRLHESSLERRIHSGMGMELDSEGDEERDGWKELKNGTESKTQVRPSEDREDYFEAEPIVSHSLTSTLLLAERKGFIEQSRPRGGYSEAIENPKSKNDISARNYSLMDKQQVRAGEQRERGDRNKDFREDYRDRIRDRDSSFPEKRNYIPEIKLEYVDDLGRDLSEKEAFRRMSHTFHGKGSGKLKAERRLKKSEDELSMKKMNSFDTPLNTVAMATRKMESSGIPYLILSGGQHSLETGSVTEAGRLAKRKK